MLTEHFLPTDLSKATPLPQQFCGLRNVSVAALQQRCQLTPTPTTEKGVVMTVVCKEQITVSGGDGVQAFPVWGLPWQGGWAWKGQQGRDQITISGLSL